MVRRCLACGRSSRRAVSQAGSSFPEAEPQGHSWVLMAQLEEGGSLVPHTVGVDKTGQPLWPLKLPAVTGQLGTEPTHVHCVCLCVCVCVIAPSVTGEGTGQAVTPTNCCESPY